jgi:hypothetical protein
MLSQHVTGRKAERMQNPQVSETASGISGCPCEVPPRAKKNQTTIRASKPIGKTPGKPTNGGRDRPRRRKGLMGRPPDLEKWHETNTQ